MKRAKPLRTVLVPAILVVFTLLFSWAGAIGSQADANVPQYSGNLSPTTAYTTAYRITLTITNLLGASPPSSRWYGPDGDQVSAGCKSGTVIRDYQYSGGSLYQVKDYFYISGCDREPGKYQVRVGIDIDKSFTILTKTYHSYLPVIVRPPTEPEPPGAFTKTSPIDGATLQPLIVTLDWADSSQADDYAYCYDTSDDGACSTWVDTGANSAANISGLAVDTTYYWQARATNELGTTYANGASTATWSFTTAGSVTPSEMIMIAAGDFEMGCDPDHNGGYQCWPSELPLHPVSLDAYYIDQYEVTNAQYAACVVAGTCTAPAESSSWTRPSYYDNPTYRDYPVIQVTWQDAHDYCAWVGKRLPTEAEWEKAARGTSPRAWPWGDNAPTCSLANFSASYSNQCVGDTDQVGATPDGASPDGVLDMAGNVREWVNDWYDADYYATSPGSNPQGPASGEDRVIRGGGYGNMGEDILAAGRSYDHRPSTGNLGFRCAADTAP